MINFVQPANVVPLTAPRDLKSGDGVFVGLAFAICTVDTKNGGTFEGMIEGGVSLKKATGYSPAQGVAAVFDETAQTLIAGAGTAVGYVYGTDPDDATRAMVKLIPKAA